MSVQAWEPQGAVIEEAFLRRCIRLSEEGQLNSLAACLTPGEKQQRSGLMQREPAAWQREDKHWPPPSAYAGDKG